MNAVVIHPEQPVSILSIIANVASSANVDVDKMERLLQMHTQMVEREARAAYAAALSQMAVELPIIPERGGIKDRSGNVQSNYALWEDVVGVITPVLSRHGFAISFRTGNDASGVTVTGVLSHALGHSEQTSLTLPIDGSGSKNAVQSVGSSTSYGKRYTAAALLNLRTGNSEDDDGQAGGGQYITADQAADIEALITECGDKINRAGFLNYIKAESVELIPATDFNRAVAALNKKRAA
jgi:hypothetical protein